MNSLPQRTSVVIPEPSVIALDILRYERLHDDITANIQSIQAQFTDMDKRGPDGERLTEHEWHNWRKRANYALQCRLREKRQLKTALAHARRIALGSGALVNPVEDMAGFRASFNGKVIYMLQALQTFKAVTPLDADAADLIECLVENLSELRDILPNLAERSDMAS